MDITFNFGPVRRSFYEVFTNDQAYRIDERINRAIENKVPAILHSSAVYSKLLNDLTDHKNNELASLSSATHSHVATLSQRTASAVDLLNAASADNARRIRDELDCAITKVADEKEFKTFLNSGMLDLVDRKMTSLYATQDQQFQANEANRNQRFDAMNTRINSLQDDVRTAQRDAFWGVVSTGVICYLIGKYCGGPGPSKGFGAMVINN